MSNELKKIDCDPMCGFMIRGHDEKELVSIAMAHLLKAHNINITEKDAKEKIKPA